MNPSEKDEKKKKVKKGKMPIPLKKEEEVLLPQNKK